MSSIPRPAKDRADMKVAVLSCSKMSHLSMSAQREASIWHMKTEDSSWASPKYQTPILIIPTIRYQLNFTRQSSGLVKEIKILHCRKEAIIAQTEIVTSTVKGEDGASKDITLSTNNNRWGAQELTLTSQMSQMIQDTFDSQLTTSQSRAWMTVEACALVVPTSKAQSIRIL